MRLLRIAFMVLVLAASLLSWNLPPSQAGSATSASGVAGHGNAEQGSLPTATAEPEEHGLSKKALEIASPFGFPITNSMVVSWIVAAGLIIFARVATRDMKWMH